LAGAARALKINARVLRKAQRRGKRRVEYKGKSLLSIKIRLIQWKHGPSDPLLINEMRGDGKVTTGITGLWRPSVHSDAAC
jgi:hypothetical protein